MVRFAGIRLGFLAYFSISGTQSFWKNQSCRGTCAVVSEQPRHQRQWNNSRLESNWEDGDLLGSCNLLEMPVVAGVAITIIITIIIAIIITITIIITISSILRIEGLSSFAGREELGSSGTANRWPGLMPSTETIQIRRMTMMRRRRRRRIVI